MKKMNWIITVCVALAVALAAPAGATLTLVTNSANLGGNMSVDWGPLGATGASVSNPHTLGIVTVSMPSGKFERQDQGNGTTEWNGNFSPGEHLLWTNYETGPMSLTFPTSVYGVGTQIQSLILGSFTAQIEAFAGTESLGTFLLDGSSYYANDGSAIYLGLLSNIAFDRVTYYTSPPTDSAYNGFAIGSLDIRTCPPSTVPLPPSAVLLGSSLLVMAVRQGRRSN